MLLYGIGARAVALMGDQKNEAEQSRKRSDRCDATGTATLANSPHSSSREGRSFPPAGGTLWGDPCHARFAIMFSPCSAAADDGSLGLANTIVLKAVTPHPRCGDPARTHEQE